MDAEPEVDFLIAGADAAGMTAALVVRVLPWSKCKYKVRPWTRTPSLACRLLDYLSGIGPAALNAAPPERVKPARDADGQGAKAE
jgi:hypothetical protein